MKQERERIVEIYRLWSPARRLFVLALCAICFCLGSVVSAEVAWPIGELDVQGVAVVTKESGGSVRVSNGTYTWFSGDRVENRSGQSLLILDNGTSFGFGENTQATVSLSEDATVVDIHQGSVLYTSEDDQEIQFLSGDAYLSNRLSNPPECVLGPVGSVGLIQLQDNGDSRVEVLEGVLYALIKTETTQSPEGDWYELAPESVYAVNGRSVVFSQDSEGSTDSDDSAPSPLMVCALPDGTPGVGTAVTAGAISMGGTTSSAVATSAAATGTGVLAGGQAVVGGFVLAVTAGSTYVVGFRDDEEEVTEPPVSP